MATNIPVPRVIRKVLPGLSPTQLKPAIVKTPAESMIPDKVRLAGKGWVPLVLEHTLTRRGKIRTRGWRVWPVEDDDSRRFTIGIFRMRETNESRQFCGDLLWLIRCQRIMDDGKLPSSLWYLVMSPHAIAEPQPLPEVQVVETIPTPTPEPEPIPEPVVDGLDELKVADLRLLAECLFVPGFKGMKKDELISAIRTARQNFQDNSGSLQFLALKNLAKGLKVRGYTKMATTELFEVIVAKLAER